MRNCSRIVGRELKAGTKGDATKRKAQGSEEPWMSVRWDGKTLVSRRLLLADFSPHSHDTTAALRKPLSSTPCTRFARVCWSTVTPLQRHHLARLTRRAHAVSKLTLCCEGLRRLHCHSPCPSRLFPAGTTIPRTLPFWLRRTPVRRRGQLRFLCIHQATVCSCCRTKPSWVE